MAVFPDGSEQGDCDRILQFNLYLPLLNTAVATLAQAALRNKEVKGERLRAVLAGWAQGLGEESRDAIWRLEALEPTEGPGAFWRCPVPSVSGIGTSARAILFPRMKLWTAQFSGLEWCRAANGARGPQTFQEWSRAIREIPGLGAWVWGRAPGAPSVPVDLDHWSHALADLGTPASRERGQEKARWILARLGMATGTHERISPRDIMHRATAMIAGVFLERVRERWGGVEGILAGSQVWLPPLPTDDLRAIGAGIAEDFEIDSPMELVPAEALADRVAEAVGEGLEKELGTWKAATNAAEVFVPIRPHVSMPEGGPQIVICSVRNRLKQPLRANKRLMTPRPANRFYPRGSTEDAELRRALKESLPRKPLGKPAAQVWARFIQEL
jgi:hypothetical protein